MLGSKNEKALNGDNVVNIIYVILYFVLFLFCLKVAVDIIEWQYNLESLPLHRWYLFLYSEEYKKPFMVAFLLALVIALIICACILNGKNIIQGDVLGGAHFASFFEIKKHGFLKRKEESILIGKKYGLPLYSNGFEHVLCFAPTGSGKTRSIGIPNLKLFPYSVIVNDVKLTLFNKTSKYRERHLKNQCYVWAPGSANVKSHSFNPLDFISNQDSTRMRDIQKIAHILIPDTKGDPIWTRASRKLFKTLVLYLIGSADAPVTFGQMNKIIKQEDFDGWLKEQLEETSHLDSEFYNNGYSYIQNHEKTRSSILETFSGYLELFDDPLVDEATARTDFDITRLRKEKISIYVGFSDDDMERLSPIINLFWQLVISTLIQNVPDLEEEPFPVLCLVDEFASLGRIERLRRSLKLLREYRVRCVLMMQYLSQTMEQYSRHEAKAFSNIKTKIAFSTDDLEDAQFVSKLIGNKTQRINTGSHAYQYNGGSRTQSYHYQSIPLMRPESVMNLKGGRALILRTGCPVMYVNQFKISPQEIIFK